MCHPRPPLRGSGRFWAREAASVGQESSAGEVGAGGCRSGDESTGSWVGGDRSGAEAEPAHPGAVGRAGGKAGKRGQVQREQRQRRNSERGQRGRHERGSEAGER